MAEKLPIGYANGPVVVIVVLDASLQLGHHHLVTD